MEGFFAFLSSPHASQRTPPRRQSTVQETDVNDERTKQLDRRSIQLGDTDRNHHSARCVCDVGILCVYVLDSWGWGLTNQSRVDIIHVQETITRLRKTQCNTSPTTMDNAGSMTDLIGRKSKKLLSYPLHPNLFATSSLNNGRKELWYKGLRLAGRAAKVISPLTPTT